MKYIELSKLKPHKDNPRKISFSELEKLCKSIKDNPEYFEARPIICDPKFIIWAGNSRYKAARKMGLEKVPVHVIDLPEEKMREIMIRDNVNNGEWDANILADDWDVDLLKDFGVEFKDSLAGETDENSDESTENKADKKKIKAKKMINCPYCSKEIEI